MAPQNVDEGGGGGNSEVKKEEDENKEEEKKEDEDKKEEDKDKKEEEGSNEGEPPAGETPVCTAQCGSGHNSQNKILECLSGWIVYYARLHDLYKAYWFLERWRKWHFLFNLGN